MAKAKRSNDWGFPRWRAYGAEREAQIRSGLGPSRISFRRGDGSERFGFNYGRIEPLATTLAATIDTIRAVKRAHRSGKDNYDAASDTYRQIYRGHDNASAVTNAEGLTVFFDPDSHDVLGFSIANFSAYYASHKTEDGEFEVNLPAKVPAPQEEEMDYDAEAIRSGVRIAEFY